MSQNRRPGRIPVGWIICIASVLAVSVAFSQRFLYDKGVISQLTARFMGLSAEGTLACMLSYFAYRLFSITGMHKALAAGPFLMLMPRMERILGAVVPSLQNNWWTGEIAWGCMVAGLLLLVGTLFYAVTQLTRMYAQLDARNRALQAEYDERRKTEEYFRSLLENAMDIIAVIEVDGTLRYVSPSVTANLGYAPDDINGKNVAAILREEDAPQIRAQLRQVLGTGNVTPRVEVRIPHREGGLRVFEVVMRQFAGDKRVIINARDITDRRAAEQRVRLLARAVEESADAVVITDPAGIVEYVNPAFESASGFIAPDLLGKYAEIVFGDKQNPPQASAIRESLDHRKYWKGRVARIRKDGVKFEQDLAISALLSETGQVERYVAVGRDLSREAKLEAQLRQTQKLEAIGTLAGGIAHDFNNLLTAINGYSTIGIREVEPDSPLAHYFGEILEAGHRAADLTRQILTFSRRSERDHEPLLATSVVKEAIKLMQGSLPATIEIVTDVDRDCPPIMGDPTQIHQVLVNLCTNAYHAMEETGGKLTVGLRKVFISKAEAENNLELHEGDWVKLTVADTGCGMDAETALRIFEPFFTTKPEGKGTGMGLAIVHGIVRSHGGSISVRSEPGRGAEFTVLLPAVQRTVRSNDVLSAPVQGYGEHILLIDDQPQVLDVSATALERLGYVVDRCRSFGEFMQTCCPVLERYQVVVSDYTMPKGTGLDVVAEVKTRRSDLPVIILSGKMDVDLAAKAKAAGAYAVLAKPYAPAEIAALLRSAIAGCDPAT